MAEPKDEKRLEENLPPTSDDPEHVVARQVDDSALGAGKIEAAHRVFGKSSRWFLFIGIGLASYIYSLDSQTTYSYQAIALSSFGQHSLISSVTIANQVIIAVGKPLVAKIANVQSRTVAYFIVMTCYVVGYIVIASAQNVSTIAGGQVIYSMGYTGLQLLTQVIIADITSLKWRGLVSSLSYSPFIINAFVGPLISAAVLSGPAGQLTLWRWGYGMFAILVPVALAPLIVTLTWAQHKAVKLGYVEPKLKEGTFLRNTWKFIDEIDLLGLILLGTGLALFLIPLTLAASADGGWNNGSIIAMLVCGIIILILFGVYDARFAKYPVIPARFLKNKAVVAASLIGFFDFIGFYLTFLYLWSFVYVVQEWSLADMGFFIQTQSVALTVFGIMGGIIMRWTHRYKWLFTAGLAIRLLGVGLMIHSRGGEGSTAEIVITQVIQGLGGGIAAITSSVGAQASVPHADVAVVTAVVLLLTEIGGAVGSAIAGAIWTNTLPGNLARELPFVSNADRALLFGNMVGAAAYPRGHPIREGVIVAYGQTMQVLLIVATVLSVIPLGLSFLMPDYYLGDAQNAVDGRDLAGEEVAANTGGDSASGDKKI